MQLVPRYLVKNKVDVVADLAGFVVEYRPVYQRQIQVYRGIENVIQFRLLNADQKPIDTSVYVPRFKAFDENNNLVIDRDCVVLDDGSSTTKGLFTAAITENDLLNIKQQFLSYTVYVVDADNKNVITYADSHFGNNGIIKVSSEAFPGAKSSKNISQFSKTSAQSDEYVSSAIDAEPGINGNTALHTAVFYTNSYVGNVQVQATLDQQINQNTVWSVLETVEFSGTETEPVPVNFWGVFNWIRFKTSNIPTETITQILVRN